jgi:cyclic dehypoxanthinyl futalosine synthase
MITSSHHQLKHFAHDELSSTADMLALWQSDLAVLAHRVRQSAQWAWATALDVLCTTPDDIYSIAYQPGDIIDAEAIPAATLLRNLPTLDHVSLLRLRTGKDVGLPFSYYTTILTALRTAYPHVYITGFSLEDLRLWSWITHRDYADLLRELHTAGLDRLDSGAISIGDRESVAMLFDCAAIADTIGLTLSLNPIFGCGEADIERAAFLARLRSASEQYSCFTMVVPHVRDDVDGNLIRHTCAVLRLALPSIPHIAADWTALGIPHAFDLHAYGATWLTGLYEHPTLWHIPSANPRPRINSETLLKLVAKSS